MPDLQTFIANTKAQPKVVNVTAQQPTAFMLQQIGTKWNLSQTPTHFTFSITSDKGVTHPVDVIIPYEIWSTIDYARVDQLLMAANRYDFTPSRHVYFLRPDIVDTEVLLGTTITPMAKASMPANLSTLVGLVNQVPTVSGVEVYPVIDTQVIADSGADAVYIEVLVQGVSNIRIDDLNTATSGSYDRYFTVVPKKVWDFPDAHAAYVENVQQTISGQKNLDAVNQSKGIKLK